MKSFRSIREGNSVEPGISEIDDVQEDPLSFVEIKPKKTKVVKEAMTDGDKSSVALQAMVARKNLQQTAGKNKSQAFVDKMVSKANAGDRLPKRPNDEYDRKVTSYLKKKYNEETEQIEEGDRQALAKKLTNKMYRIGKGLGNLAKNQNNTNIVTNLKNTKSDMHKAVGMANDSTVKKMLNKEEAELEEGIKSKIAGIALSALAAHGAAHGRVTPDGQGGFTGGFKPHPSATAPASAPAAEAPKGFSREYLQDVVDGKHPRPLLSKERAAEHLKNMKEEARSPMVDLVKKFQTVRRHAIAKSRAKKLVTASKSASAAGDKMTADTAMSKSKRYSNIAKGMEEQMEEKLTSKDIKMAVGVAKDKRYAGGNMSGAVKTMEKMKPGLSKHPRVQQVLQSTQEGFDKLSPQQKAHQYNLDSAQREIDRRHGEGEDMTGAKINKKTYEINKPKKLRVTEGVDFLKIWKGIKPVHEEVKTTHEDPLVLTKDAEGHIHTHANLSVANAIHGTNVKHQAIHTGKPVQAGKFTFELSKHHEGALKEDAPFDPVAHKKELDQLMGKHMAAHTQTTKLINAKAPQEQINKAQERNNAVKQEIRNHKDKVPKGPAPKPGSAADYYASKKPGEYTGD